MALISFIAGPHEGSALKLPDVAFTLGRDEDAGFTLNDEAVSRHHVEIRPAEGGGWIVTDLDSANGTLVNGEPASSHFLSEGDVVQIGDSQFTFFAEDAYGEEVAPVADAEVPPEEEQEPLSEEQDPSPEAAEEPPPAALEFEAEVQEATPVAAETEAPAAEPDPAPRQEQKASSGDQQDLGLVREMAERTQRIRKELSKVIVGQAEVIEQILMCIVAGGHALLIGLPGMAKTLTVATLARVLNLDFKRVQFTPDLMPSDIIGTDVLETNQATGDKEFRFIRGPIFCNMLLADEINRTPPKTQAALLEAMQEKCVTAGNQTYRLDKPFFVLATQNPIEQEGTYPLPEAQLDRFMFNIWVDYPEEHEEEQIIGATTSGISAVVNPVMTKEEIIQVQEVVRKVPVSEHVIKYAIRLVRATRPGDAKAPEVSKNFVSTGAGPRAGQNLILAAKAMAILEGRIHVSCNDIRRAAIPVLRHRLQTNFAADSEGRTPISIVEELLKTVKEPGEQDYEAAAPVKKRK